jgi:hypothetical protein
VPALNFFVDFAVSGRVEGVGLDSAPEDWSEHLGKDYIDDISKSKKRLRRDYGLVELGFYRPGGAWRCFLVSIQAHRLWWDNHNAPAKLRSKYGPFPRVILFEDLRRELSALGHEPSLIEDEDPSDQTRYYMPEAKILIGVNTPKPQEEDDIPSGAIWAMHLSEDADIWARPRKK